MLVPSWSGPPSTAYWVEATPEPASAGVSFRVTLPLVQVFEPPVIAVVGAVRSMLTGGALVAVVPRPAPFFTVTLLARLLPSPEIVVSAGWVGIPDSASDAVQWIVTSSRYQPEMFGWVVGEPDNCGGVVSPAWTAIVVDAVLPALSVAVPVTLPEVRTVTWLVELPVARQVATPDACCWPELLSLQVKVTVTLPSGLRTEAPLMDGFALSMRTTTVPVPVLPSL